MTQRYAIADLISTANKLRICSEKLYLKYRTNFDEKRQKSLKSVKKLEIQTF